MRKKPKTLNRNYRKEYDEYQGKPAQRKYRSELNKENRKRGTYGNGDGKDVAHSKPRSGKTKLQPASINRAGGAKIRESKKKGGTRGAKK